MKFEEKLRTNFHCAKCCGKSAVTRMVPLSGGLPNLLALASDKYVLLTCALCGYTEIYSTAAHAVDEETAAEAKPAVQTP
ncbi:MAG: hypothetical protein K1X53_12590 [Candidatus Sumerlaeaceae bacterium]|nr:hypothetical protein [Candidatus Sumerlaeaceae bacterium]